jgi:hypothetical protein
MQKVTNPCYAKLAKPGGKTKNWQRLAARANALGAAGAPGNTLLAHPNR